MKKILINAVLMFFLLAIIVILATFANDNIKTTTNDYEPTPTAEHIQPTEYIEIGCLEEEHKTSYVTSNPCMTGSYSVQNYGNVQVLPSQWTSKFYPNYYDEIGGEVIYNRGYSLQLGYWSGGWSLTSEPFVAKAGQCYLAFVYGYADHNTGNKNANQDDDLAVNNLLEIFAVGKKRSLIGKHPTVILANVDDFSGVNIYNIKGNRRMISAFLMEKDEEIKIEFKFTTMWQTQIHETNWTFLSAYVIKAESNFCESVDSL